MRGRGPDGDTASGDICPILLTSAHIGDLPTLEISISQWLIISQTQHCWHSLSVKTIFAAQFFICLQTVSIFPVRRQSLSQVTEISKIIGGASSLCTLRHTPCIFHCSKIMKLYEEINWNLLSLSCFTNNEEWRGAHPPHVRRPRISFCYWPMAIKP